MVAGSFYSRSVTATANTQFRVDDNERITLSSINIHCYLADAFYGERASQTGIIRANAVVWFDKPVKIADLWFKNVVAGANAQIVITGTVLQD